MDIRTKTYHVVRRKAAIVIEYLMSLCIADITGCDTILFLYCRHNETWTISHYLGSLIEQMFTDYRHLTSVEEHVHKLYDVHKTRRSYPSKTVLITVLSNMILCFRNVRIVLDALDELSDRDQVELISILRALPVSLFFTSRIIGLEIFNLPDDTIHMSIGEQNQVDIRLFLHDTIPRTASVARTVRQNKEYLEEICDKILTTSNGMFLLATLKSQSLEGYTTMTSLTNSLDGLPDDIQSMYLSLMDSINSQKGEYPSFVKRAMTWIMYARRPLTASELQHALAIRDGENSFNTRDIPTQDLFTTLSCGIIEIQPRSQTVRLVPYEFLDGHPDTLLQTPHFFIAKSCITYLTAFRFTTLGKMSYAAFEALVKSQDAPLLEYAYQNWVFHVRECGEDSYPTETVHNFILKVPNYPLFDSRIGFSWINPGHVIAYYNLRVQVPWDIFCESRTTKKHTALTLAALNGCTSVVASILACKQIDVNAQTKSGDTALILACKEFRPSIHR
ncbi:hypothetical protein JR316_0012029 [Psilocybe cubensis]|uniref:Uncharacterized protein n=1 Tax=Psilocybe cubensis TaxID=181762 RepID=A0ACB8GIN3_PSICU|nr:hypothetical protein JR316_0012029 [Psilocybe cubensis]KAH9474934.1 hypothetical protein JR316_0012029 [Psilocybe cubensis]